MGGTGRFSVALFCVVFFPLCMGSTGHVRSPGEHRDFVLPTGIVREEVLAASLASTSGILILGEIHGTREMPRFVGRLVCELAVGGHAVHVALEEPGNLAPLYEKISSRDVTFEEFSSELSNDTYWKLGKDGRYSRDVFSLLLALKLLATQGVPVRVFPFDMSPPVTREALKKRQSTMAANLARHVRAEDEDAPIVVITGRVHAAYRPGQMAGLLRRRLSGEAVRRIISLRMDAVSGDAWTCLRDGCGVHRLPERAFSRRPAPGELLVRSVGPDYDAEVVWPVVHASPPAGAVDPKRIRAFSCAGEPARSRSGTEP